jgi:outer membrane protein assembly factor BamB
MRLLRKLLKIVALLVVVTGVVLAVLVFGFGMRVQPDGTGMWPTVSFESPEAHYARLEAQRASQRGSAPRTGEGAATPPESSAPAPAPSVPTTAPAAGGGPSNAAEPAVAPATPAAAATPAVPPVDASGGVKTSWTGFRGPRRDGVYREAAIRTTWDAAPPRELWKQPVGDGFSSFAIAGGRAFTIEQRRDQEVVSAYDVETGRELWTNGWSAHFTDSTGDGPRATPTWHDGRLYALGALGELRALDAGTGRVAWRRNILEENQAVHPQWAMAASPLVVDGKVIVLPGGGSRNSVVAYDAESGAKVWSVLDDRQAYTAPMVATLAGRRQIVVVSARRMVGLTIDDGTLLWEYPWVTDYDVNASQPIAVAHNRLFVSAGYGHGAIVLQLAVDGDRLSVKPVWQNTRMKNKFSSSVYHDGHIYGLDEAILACVDAATGELRWKGGRYGYGQLVLAGNHVIVLTERGELALVRATPAAHQEVALVPAIDGRTWNHPAINDGRLLVRNGREMAAFDLRP